MPKHMEIRNQQITTKVTGSAAITHTSNERWCAYCRRWEPCIGIMGAMEFIMKHHTKDDPHV
jgi:hypothetical protein